MPEGPDGKTIIIVKKVVGHGGGHHGGAWKVAYADFVTAMMALFMVLWLINQSSVATRERIANFFKQPGVFEKGSGSPLQIGGAGILPDAFSPPQEGNSSVATGRTNRIYNVDTSKGKPAATSDEVGMAGDGSKRIEGGKGIGSGDLNVKNDYRDFEKIEMERAGIERIAGALNQQIKQGGADGAGYGAGNGGGGVGGGAGSGIGMDSGGLQSGGSALGGPAAGGGAGLGTGLNTPGGNANALGLKGIDGKMLGNVQVRIDQRGLHLEIMDTPTASMFETGSSNIKKEAEAEIEKIGKILSTVPNPVDIEGHTDGNPFSERMKDSYDNWNLSSDRANAARRALVKAGIPEKQIARVVGYADKRPKSDDPLNSANRRISVSMRYTEMAAKALKTTKAVLTEPKPVFTPIPAKKKAVEEKPIAIATPTPVAAATASPAPSATAEATPTPLPEAARVIKAAPSQGNKNLAVEVGVTVPEGDVIADEKEEEDSSWNGKDKIFGNKNPFLK
ncbi:MAG: OmpA family protein [Proteobacteria bacterium]|nr:OmpA family protein [Pseudomonadota bacterium]